MVDASLCILACNRPAGVHQLVESVRAFDNLRVEVVIGDNSTSAAAQRDHRGIADVWFRVSDRKLWFDGFGPCKTRVVSAASHDLVMVADADERWLPTPHTPRLLSEASVARTGLLERGEAVAEHGRVFDRREWRLMGMLHEELYHRRTRVNWGSVAPYDHVARIEHDKDSPDPLYLARKAVLYDNLLYRIGQDPSISPGTTRHWVDVRLPRRIAEGFEPVTFEQWSEEFYVD